MSRKLAIGDIHGCLKSLKTLLASVAPASGDTVIMLGDYVDRGPDSKGVIDYLINWPWKAKLVLLRGNHETIMEEASRSTEHFAHWCNVGGVETLTSYDGELADVPEQHWELIKNCRSYYETKKVIYVHGGVAPKKALAKQDEVEMTWRRFSEAKKHFSGKLVICGHTVQRKGVPTDVGHTICIDTAACRGGWLTCVEAKTRRYWQANEKKRTRKGTLKKSRSAKTSS